MVSALAIEVKDDTVVDSFDKLEAALSSVDTQEKANEFFGNVKKLEKLLKAADLFNRKSREYAMLEAKTYVRICELGMVEQIPSNNYQRQIAKWFIELNESERDEVVEMCGSENTTIGAIWKKHVKEPEMVERSINAMKESGEFAIWQFKEDGIVNIDNVFRSSERDSRIPADVFNGYKDTIRNRLRKMEGHSVEDRPGVYVSTEYAKKHFIDIRKAKMNSIEKDFGRLIDTIREMRDSSFDFDLSIETKSNFTYELTERSVINLAVCLLDGATPSFTALSERVEAAIIVTLIKHLGWTVSDIVRATFEDAALGATNAEEKCIDMLGFSEDEKAILMEMYKNLHMDEIAERASWKLSYGYCPRRHG